MWLSTPELKQVPWWIRILFRLQKKKYGQILMPTRYWAGMPKLFLLFSAMNSYFERRRSTLDPALRSLIQVRVSQINACSFCMDLNAYRLAERSGSLKKVEALKERETDPLFSESERAALRYADEVSRSEIQIPPPLQEQLKLHFSEAQILELTALVAFQNLSAKFNAALDIPSQHFCIK